MRKILYCLVAVFLCQSLQAQQTDFTRIVQPVEMKSRDFKEYLVQLAWLNLPENHVLEEEVKIAEEDLKVAKKDWMRDLALTFNLNEANLRNTNSSSPTTKTVTTVERINSGPLTTRELTTTEPPAANNNVFFPRYNFGATVNLGTMATMKNRKKIKESGIKIAEHKVNQQKLAVRAEVLRRYQAVLLSSEILKTRTQVEQDAQSNFLLISQLYKTDEKTFEDYNSASTAYTGAQESRLKAESDMQLAIYEVEEVIGVQWKDVQHAGKTPNQ